MARFETKTISRRTVEALEVEKDTVFWDSELSGFGVRVYPSGSKYYVVQTRAGGRAAKRVTVGRHGVVTAEEARQAGGAHHRADQGGRGARSRTAGGGAAGGGTRPGVSRGTRRGAL